MTPADWWLRLRDDPRFREPLRYGFAKHCYQVVAKRLSENRDNNCFPSTWAELTSALSMSGEGSVFRKRKGILPTSTLECLAIATLLDVEPDAFIPTSEAWLEAAVSKACKDSGASVSNDDVRTFVLYMLRYFQKHRADEVSLSEIRIEDDVIHGVTNTNQCNSVGVRASVQKVLVYLGEGP